MVEPMDKQGTLTADQPDDPMMTADWLLEIHGDAGLRIVDASWYLPAQNRDAMGEFATGHIPGAVFFDIDAHSDTASPLPHMLPDTTGFSHVARGLGLSNDNLIVVYDGMGLFSAARVWWMLKSFGATNVRVLDGGLPAWNAAGGALEPGTASPIRGSFKAALDAAAVCDIDDIQTLLRTGAATVADARAAGRFEGTEPEPRPGSRSGHMPGARNIPFTDLLDVDRLLGSPAAIMSRFADAGIDLDKPIVTSCGSGVTAAVLNLALARAGKHDVAVFDGSWAQWGTDPDMPVVTGEADD